MNWLETKALFDYEGTLAVGLLANTVYPWEALEKIPEYVASLAEKLIGRPGWRVLGQGIVAAESAVVSPNAILEGPLVIGPRAEIRPNAYIRGNVLVGADCLVGNAVELKKCVLLDGARAERFNYISHSVIGRGAMLAAGAVTAIIRLDYHNISVHDSSGMIIDTGKQKVGAIVADGATVGCQAVLNPGSVLCKKVSVYPGVSFSGVARENSLVKGI